MAARGGHPAVRHLAAPRAGGRLPRRDARQHRGPGAVPVRAGQRLVLQRHADPVPGAARPRAAAGPRPGDADPLPRALAGGPRPGRRRPGRARRPAPALARRAAAPLPAPRRRRRGRGRHRRAAAPCRAGGAARPGSRGLPVVPRDRRRLGVEDGSLPHPVRPPTPRRRAPRHRRRRPAAAAGLARCPTRSATARGAERRLVSPPRRRPARHRVDRRRGPARRVGRAASNHAAAVRGGAGRPARPGGPVRAAAAGQPALRRDPRSAGPRAHPRLAGAAHLRTPPRPAPHRHRRHRCAGRRLLLDPRRAAREPCRIRRATGGCRGRTACAVATAATARRTAHPRPAATADRRRHRPHRRPGPRARHHRRWRDRRTPGLRRTGERPVRIVDGPQDFAAFTDGEVLVAKATAPAWTPLFGRAAGVVTDGGTLAAHASLIAREYGIPAVVGTGDATHQLRTGQLVTVDGTTGTVTVHPADPAPALTP
ncbi:PEP-utilizing enzyme [Dactylosporangium sp. NPDC048998]|uniref:PEP-utilizing enzyme n=1 Tax=Dactylosporangium sp. NPDC048998 TaxID=3363976 RepID=UPI00371D58FD